MYGKITNDGLELPTGYVFKDENGNVINATKIVLEKKKKIMTRPEKFREIAEEIASLYEVKDNAYGDSFGDTYNKLGIVSAATRISDKTNRLCRLATNPQIDDLGESIKDTLMDLAAYSIMTIMKLK